MRFLIRCFLPALFSVCCIIVSGFFLAINASGMGAVAGGPHITALETEWSNMSMMQPGDTSRHRLEIDRKAREIRHSILINGVNGAERDPTIHVYPLEAAACEDFFVFLEQQRPDRWRDDYAVDMLDGWAWKLRILYKDGLEKRVKGNANPPPGGEEISRRIRALAPFAKNPLIF